MCHPKVQFCKAVVKGSGTRLFLCELWVGFIFVLLFHVLLSAQLITWGTPDIRRPGNVIMMVADVLAPNRRQATSNHHVDTTMTSDKDVMLRPSKQVISKGGRQPVGFYVIVGFAISQW